MRIVIVGAGEVGFHIASRLSHENKDVVVIDNNPEALRRVSENIDVQVIQGSGSSPLVLEEAGVKSAEILLAVTNHDETNLVTCLIADILSPSTRKLARIREADYDQCYDQFHDNAPHIDTIINPEIEVVKTIDRLMQVPGAVDVSDFAEGRIKFVGIKLEPTARLAGVQLSELPKITGDKRPLIAAVVRDEKIMIPHGEDRLLAGDLVYFISEEVNLLDTLAVFDKHSEPLKRILIIGGGRIGYRLTDLLEQRSLSTKIIERSSDRCSFLAKKLNKAVVLCGDGSDQDLLNEVNIQDTDVVVTLTNDDETNILTSLLAQRLGARKTITRVSKFGYFPLMASIGIEQVVSPRLSAINSILQHIRKGKVISDISIKGEEAEVMEAVALATSGIVSKPLKRLAFPKGAMVAGIVRGEKIIIPTGDSVIEPDDRVIIFATRKAVPGIEKLLSVKLEFF